MEHYNYTPCIRLSFIYRFNRYMRFHAGTVHATQKCSTPTPKSGASGHTPKSPPKSSQQIQEISSDSSEPPPDQTREVNLVSPSPSTRSPRRHDSSGAMARALHLVEPRRPEVAHGLAHGDRLGTTGSDRHPHDLGT